MRAPLQSSKIKPYHPSQLRNGWPRIVNNGRQRSPGLTTLNRAWGDQANTSTNTKTGTDPSQHGAVKEEHGAAGWSPSAVPPTSSGLPPELPASSLTLSLEIVRSISSVDAAQWDSVATTAVPAPPNSSNPPGTGNSISSDLNPSKPAAFETNPFVLHAFLLALETSGSVAPSQGWVPSHLLVRDATSDQLLGCCPLYIKGHSQGEFVFDQSWANLSHQLGKPYYPKLQSCVPFTPCPGPRLMVHGDAGLDPDARRQVIRAMGRGLIQVAQTAGMSSVHVTFNNAEEWAVLAELGFLQRTGIQFHWDNRGYADFEAFLAELKQSKRKVIRQERKSIPKQDLQVRVLTGAEIQPHHWDIFYRFYLDTIDRYASFAYLTREFFHTLGQVLPERVMLVLAEAPKTSDGDELGSSGEMEVVAAALNLVGSHALFGRNWGCSREFRNLHFELCYYQAVEQAIQRGMQRVEAGAQGVHKLQRGYMPSLTYSSHYLLDPTMRFVVSRALDSERAAHLQQLQQLAMEASPYKDQAMLELLVQRVQAHQQAVHSSSSSSSSSSNSSSSDPSD